MDNFWNKTDYVYVERLGHERLELQTPNYLIPLSSKTEHNVTSNQKDMLKTKHSDLFKDI